MTTESTITVEELRKRLNEAQGFVILTLDQNSLLSIFPANLNDDQIFMSLAYAAQVWGEKVETSRLNAFFLAQAKVDTPVQ